MAVPEVPGAPFWTMSNMAQLLALPVTAIRLDALIVPSPADCMRSPVLFVPAAFLVLMMIALFAVIETPAEDDEGPVALAALTALPPGLSTVTPDSSVRLNGVEGPPPRLMLVVYEPGAQVWALGLP